MWTVALHFLIHENICRPRLWQRHFYRQQNVNARNMLRKHIHCTYITVQNMIKSSFSVEVLNKNYSVLPSNKLLNPTTPNYTYIR